MELQQIKSRVLKKYNISNMFHQASKLSHQLQIF